jgi:hypothetical protein
MSARLGMRAGYFSSPQKRSIPSTSPGYQNWLLEAIKTRALGNVGKYALD